MAELTEEQKAAAAAEAAAKEAEAKAAAEAAKAAAAKTKKKAYADLKPSDTIVFEVSTADTKVVKGVGVQVVDKKVEKSMTKAGWDLLEEWGAETEWAGKKKDITDSLKAPKLIGYVENGKVIKF